MLYATRLMSVIAATLGAAPRAPSVVAARAANAGPMPTKAGKAAEKRPKNVKTPTRTRRTAFQMGSQTTTPWAGAR